ncbi:TatD family hydrolase [Candidatus Roizmanbacteria bacterium]|nr:TatD family hydrolase [Candidatus Roizmanbacteria bacterium]
MIDLHSHLDLYPNALELLERVGRENRFTLVVTTSPRAWLATTQVFRRYNNIKVALGLHPEVADKKFNEFDLLLSSIHKTNFIGEVGIDGSARNLNTLEKQELIFKSTIRECEKVGGRVISIHSRDAVSKVLTTIRTYENCGIPILHWFSGSVEELTTAIKMGCYFSINPVMIRGEKGRELISRIPCNLILPESDGPFVKMAGRPIMPWEAMNICSDLSRIWRMPIESVKDMIEENFKKLLQGMSGFSR